MRGGAAISQMRRYGGMQQRSEVLQQTRVAEVTNRRCDGTAGGGRRARRSAAKSRHRDSAVYAGRVPSAEVEEM